MAALSMFERFDQRARRAVVLSGRKNKPGCSITTTSDHNYIGTEHILLGLIRERDGVAAQVLVKLGADLNQMRQQMLQLLQPYQGGGQVFHP
jgi:ATP-dependent Clp protease ATP-binding subunit ClpA